MQTLTLIAPTGAECDDPEHTPETREFFRHVREMSLRGTPVTFDVKTYDDLELGFAAAKAMLAYLEESKGEAELR